MARRGGALVDGGGVVYCTCFSDGIVLRGSGESIPTDVMVNSFYFLMWTSDSSVGTLEHGK